MFKNGILARHHIFTFSELEQIPNFVHLIVGRPCASDKIDADQAGEVALLPPGEVLTEFEMDRFRLVPVRQIHSDRTIVLNRIGDNKELLQGADGIVALEPGACPVIRTADCVPIMAVIPPLQALGIFHAGWRGTCNRVVEKGVELLLRSTGARPEEVVAAIGPAIRRCCYEVGSEVEAEFQAAGHRTEEIFRNGYLDLVEANKAQLLRLGVTSLLDSGSCTACHPEFFYSYRRDRTTGRMWTIGGFKTPKKTPLSLWPVAPRFCR